MELIAVRILGLASTVLRAYGGREAIETARRELPDLIVLDLMMPDVNGFDVVEALKQRPDTARIPILVVTAKADHRRGPRQAEWLRDGDRGKGRVRPRPLRGRSPAGDVGTRRRSPDMATVLVVEDNPANMTLAVFLLESAGHTVLSATDAEAGLTLARAEQPDLILMDIQLPGMDGLEATVLLKQRRRDARHSGHRAHRAGDEGRRGAHPRRRLRRLHRQAAALSRSSWRPSRRSWQRP